VENARFKMGEKLAATIKKELGPDRLAQVDVVIPIPETSNTSARAVAKHLKKELVNGFVKASELKFIQRIRLTIVEPLHI